MPRRRWDVDSDSAGRSRKRRTPIESIIAGSVFTLIFGGLLISKGEWFWAFPMAVAGVFPAVEGIRRLVTGTRDRKLSSLEREAETEKQILRIAREQNGKVTASLAALGTNLTIKEAEGVLERMAREGHAVMNVTSDGRLVFEFPEFLPQLRSDSL